MEEDSFIKRQQRLLIILFAVALLFSIITIVYYNITIGQDRIVGQLFRLIVRIILMLYVLEGNKWANRFLILFYIYECVQVWTNNKVIAFDHWYSFLYIIMVTYYGFLPVFLLVNTNVNRFFRLKSTKR